MRRIITNIEDKEKGRFSNKGYKATLLCDVSTQLSDGYFESDETVPADFECYWKFLEFKITNYGLLEINVSEAGSKGGSVNIFKGESASQVRHFVADVIEYVFDRADYVFSDYIEEDVYQLCSELRQD